VNTNYSTRVDFFIYLYCFDPCKTTVASTAYHLQSFMHVKSLDTGSESVNRLNSDRNYIPCYHHYCPGM